MGRVAHGLIARSLLRRNLAPPPFSSYAAAAAAAAQRTVPIASSCGTASDVATSPRPRWWLFSLPVAPSRSVSVGLAGALSFSLTLVTAAEAKEPPSPELIPKDVVLYQYEACPFCNKVKAFLDYHDVPYKVVEVNPLSKKEIKWSDYKKVPILVVDGEQLIESSDIVKKLSQRFRPENSVIDEEETKWLRWVDDHLVHMLSPNIYRTTSEALESFDYIAKHVADLNLDEVHFLKGLGHLAIGKHLCGPATDLTIRCCLNREYNQSKETHSTSSHLKGIALATCCHHLCQWKHYTNTKFLLSLGITEEEFHAMTWFTSWAVDADHSSELSDVSHQETNLSTICSEDKQSNLEDSDVEQVIRGMPVLDRAHLGFICKEIIDIGRLLSLRDQGMDAQLVKYVPSNISPENHLLLAKSRFEFPTVI